MKSFTRILLSLGLAVAPVSAFAATDPAATCSAITGLTSGNLVITKAELLAAAPMSMPAAHVELPMPAHCLVQGQINPRKGVGGKDYAIGFELRLPADWNGRFLFQGGGGLDGKIVPAVGMNMSGSTPGLSRGFAVVSTDAGHEGDDASFAADQQARLDYAYNALGQVTTTAKLIIGRYYGKAPKYSYFSGCSNGGRQGMMLAERFPTEFDGIVAGDPGFRLSRAAVGQAWDAAQFTKIAPHDKDGAPILSQALTDDDLKLVSAAVLKKCDALDGLADGMINDVKACHFDPASLQCAGGATASCLTKAKVDALKAVFGGAHDSKGEKLYASWPYDAGVADRNWRLWKLGFSPTAKSDSLAVILGADSLSHYFSTPPKEISATQPVDFDTIAAQTAFTGAIHDPTSTFLTTFVARGGRLLIYQGVSDPVFSANDIIGWYEKLLAEQASAQDTARLFLIPGMTHCAGGPATDQFDALDAVQNWVEKGAAPDRIIAHGKSFPGQSRPLCAFPKVARYTGGDTSAEASFTCQ